jgi:glucose/arabinose dehydrogenase
VGENANGANAQTLTNLLGKLLRINPDGSIPSDNPFFASASGVNRAIWALGLRNPFSFAIQRGTGRMFINDVGENTREEINDGIVGSNYGWPATEGATADPSFRSPLFAYGHGSSPTTGCTIAGGAFYNPQTAADDRAGAASRALCPVLLDFLARVPLRPCDSVRLASAMGGVHS